jgi:hypothetical protein
MTRYVPLLVALFGFLILQPIAVSLSGANIPVNLLMYMVIATAIYAVGPRKSLVAATTILALAIVAVRLLNEKSPAVRLVIFSHGLSFVLMVLVAVTIVVRVFKAREITAEIIRRGVRLSHSRRRLDVSVFFPSDRGARIHDGTAACEPRQRNPTATETVPVLGNAVLQHVCVEHHGISEHGAPDSAGPPVSSGRSDHGPVVRRGAHSANRGAQHGGRHDVGSHGQVNRGLSARADTESDGTKVQLPGNRRFSHHLKHKGSWQT